jgi:hypothetical protein
MSFYDKHVFCTNLRADGGDRCGKRGAPKAREYMKNKVAELGISSLGNNIHQRRGCRPLRQGPVIVVYPEGIWYSYMDEKTSTKLSRSISGMGGSSSA